jgi:hypothetical protein
MAETDQYENDPFFKKIHDTDWNACIGRQGHEENYLDGYIEAAIELADAIIEQKLFAKRDTLVLPILYNARHAVELALKFTTERLVAIGVVKNDGRKLSHNIKAYWDHLHDSAVGDEKLSKTIIGLKPYIDSLSQIDSDGQELRYHRNRDNDPSLAKYAIANLRLIQSSLRELEKLLSDLKYRTVDFVDEHATGSFTNRCSRKDLIAIAEIMPRRDQWATEAFDKQKAVVKERFGLSNKQFSIALNRIQQVPAMRAILGLESDLPHLTDVDIVWVVEQWRRLHPVRKKEAADVGINYFDPARLKAMKEKAAVRKEVVTGIESRLSLEALAALETMFYLDRDRVFSEHFEKMMAETLKEHAAAKDPQEEISHLMEKTNFLQCVQGATTKLGRLSLAKRLKEFEPAGLSPAA